MLGNKILLLFFSISWRWNSSGRNRLWTANLSSAWVWFQTKIAQDEVQLPPNHFHFEITDFSLSNAWFFSLYKCFWSIAELVVKVCKSWSFIFLQFDWLLHVLVIESFLICWEKDAIESKEWCNLWINGTH